MDGLADIVNGTCHYTGTEANREYEKLTGCPVVPLEFMGSEGTACKQ